MKGRARERIELLRARASRVETVSRARRAWATANLQSAARFTRIYVGYRAAKISFVLVRAAAGPSEAESFLSATEKARPETQEHSERPDLQEPSARRKLRR